MDMGNGKWEMGCEDCFRKVSRWVRLACLMVQECYPALDSTGKVHLVLASRRLDRVQREGNVNSVFNPGFY